MSAPLVVDGVMETGADGWTSRVVVAFLSATDAGGARRHRRTCKTFGCCLYVVGGGDAGAPGGILLQLVDFIWWRCRP